MELPASLARLLVERVNDTFIGEGKGERREREGQEEEVNQVLLVKKTGREGGIGDWSGNFKVKREVRRIRLKG